MTYKPQRQVLKGHQFFPSAECIYASPTAIAFASASDTMGTVFRAPKSGTILGFRFGTRSVTTGATLRCSLQTVANGVSTGTLIAAGASGTVVVANTDDNVIKTITFDTPQVVNKGDLMCVVLDVSAGTPAALQVGRLSSAYYSAPPYAVQFLAGVTTNGAAALLGLMPIYSTGDEHLAPNALPHTNSTNKSISTATAVNELGLRFTMPFNAVTDGFQWRCVTTSAQPVDGILYDAATDTVLRSFSIDAGVLGQTPNATNIGGDWPTPLNLVRGKSYRLTIKPTGATAFNAIAQISGIFKKPVGLEDAIYCERATGGAWTEIADSTCGIQLSLSGINFPDGSYI